MPKLIQSISELRQIRKDLKGSVGLVPTMGALHAGHATLMRKLRTQCDHLFLSVFVNPTQFGPKEDFSKYPRTLEEDCNVADQESVDFIFSPRSQEIYPEGFSTYVEESLTSSPLCGPLRPGHFRGVTTVVLKLLNLVEPHVCFFGLKDAQQFFVLRKMAQDLNINCRIEAVQTVREPDGLALSSRNIYLTPDEREKAPLIYATLRALANVLEKGISEDPFDAAKELLFKEGFDVQYLELCSLPSLHVQKWDQIDPSLPHLIATAVKTPGGTRLIDNVILNEPKLQSLGISIN